MTTRLDFADRGLAEMIDAIALEHHCTVKEILSKDKTAHVNRARRAVCVKLRELNMSYPAIGRLMGRDHATVYEAVFRKRWTGSRHGRDAAE